MTKLIKIIEHLLHSMGHKHTHETPSPQIFKTHQLEWTPQPVKKTKKVKK